MNSKKPNKTVILYTTSGCHLCDQAEKVFRICLAAMELEAQPVLEKVDVADDPELFALYGESIPVLQIVGIPVALYWPFNEKMLEDYFDTFLGMKD